MKQKVFLTVLLLAAVLLFAACGPDVSAQDSSDLVQSKIYSTAVSLGFQGTLEEFLELVKGKDGVSITDIYVNENGELTVDKSNGESVCLGSVKGKDGLGIGKIYIDSHGNLIIEFTDGRIVDYGIVKGETGANGKDGEKGESGAKGDNGLDGRGIETLYITKDGQLVIKFTDEESEIIVGKVTGENGKDGINGIDGKDGADGKDGINGIDGKDGADGKDGINGIDGKDGADGKDGVDGTNGLSAYEIYVKYHPEYKKSEREWIEDLVAGRLSGDNSYSITVICGNDVYNLKVNDGECIDLSGINPNKAGYNFCYWTVNGEKFDTGTPIDETMTLTAKYIEAEITDIVEHNDLWDGINMESMTRYRINVSADNSCALNSLTFSADCGKIELLVYSIYDEVAYKMNHDFKNGEAFFDATAFCETGAYILDITYRNDGNEKMTIMPHIQ